MVLFPFQIKLKFQGFDKGRTKSRLGNKFVYCWEGFKKYFIKTPRVNDIVENIQVTKMTEDGQEV